MSKTIDLRRPGAQVGDHDEVEAAFEVEPFDLYGRRHEVTEGTASVGVTHVSDGVYLDLKVRATVRTTCDRTLEPLDLHLEFADSDLLEKPYSEDYSVADWELDLDAYAGKALPSEIPMQAFAPDTEPVEPQRGENEIDPRWRGLDDLFASGF